MYGELRLAVRAWFFYRPHEKNCRDLRRRVDRQPCKADFLLGRQIGKADKVFLIAFHISVCIARFALQRLFAKAVKSTAYLKLGASWFIQGVYLFSQPRKRVIGWFPLSLPTPPHFENCQIKTVIFLKKFLKKTKCARSQDANERKKNCKQC